MPPVKIFIDSSFRKDGTNSDFSFGLPRPIEINKQYKAFIDQVHVPHVWTTIIAGINSCVYLEEVYDNSSGDRVTRQRKITLEAKQYTIDTLAAQLQSKFNHMARDGHDITKDFHCGFDNAGKLHGRFAEGQELNADEATITPILTPRLFIYVVYMSERDTGFNNYALAHFMRASHGHLSPTQVEDNLK